MRYPPYKFDAGSEKASRAIQELAIKKGVRTTVCIDSRYFIINDEGHLGRLNWFTYYESEYKRNSLPEITFNAAWEILNDL